MQGDKKTLNDYKCRAKKALTNYLNITNSYKKFCKKRIPLCAAENVISPFARIPLSSDMQERYIMGGLYNFEPESNFIGSQHLHPFYKLINQLCSDLFNCSYADPRPLSGISCIISLLMTLTKSGQKVLLLMPDQGGHPSYPHICNRLGLSIIPMPFNHEQYNIDTEEISRICKMKKVDFLILAPSDILFPPPINEIDLPEELPVIYDATQTMGLIASKQLPNPLMQKKPLILIGGTHKTLPGPTNGLIMTNDNNIALQIDKKLNPTFLRNTQMHQVACLALSLIEFEAFGFEYGSKTVKNANLLGKLLTDRNFNVVNVNNIYTKTHQIFVKMNSNNANKLYLNSLRYGVTLNKKNKKLFNNNGIRLGVQEVTRYGWNNIDFINFSKLFYLLSCECKDCDYSIDKLLHSLEQKKTVYYTFTEEYFAS